MIRSVIDFNFLIVINDPILKFKNDILTSFNSSEPNQSLLMFFIALNFIEMISGHKFFHSSPRIETMWNCIDDHASVHDGFAIAAFDSLLATNVPVHFLDGFSDGFKFSKLHESKGGAVMGVGFYFNVDNMPKFLEQVCQFFIFHVRR